jgi:hypothetical protein
MTRSLRRTSLLAAACLSFVAGCAHRPGPSTARIETSGDVVTINGPITEEAAERFLSAIDAGPVARVRIASGGGGVEPAIRMAEQIYRRGLDVEVVGPCFSSCANYIFPAGRRKFISGTGIVGWHGNIRHLLYLHETGGKRMSDTIVKDLQRVTAMEAQFFQLIGVDEYVCWFAKIAPYNVHNLYFMSAEDMARFGITDVSVRADYASSDLSPYRHWGRENLRFVRVDWPSLSRPAMAMK